MTSYKILIIVSRGIELGAMAPRAVSTSIIEFHHRSEAEVAANTLLDTKVKSAVIEIVKLYE